MNYLRLGDVIRNEGKLWIVDLVSESRARCRCLGRVAFDTPISVSTTVPEPEDVVERRGVKGLQDFLASKKASARANESTSEAEQRKEDSMPNQAKARGGLAADIASDRPRSKSVKAKAPRAPKGPKAPKVQRESRASFIDSMFDGKHTKDEIVDATHKKFGGDKDALRKAVSDRPFHMRKAGKEPKWKESAAAA